MVNSDSCTLYNSSQETSIENVGNTDTNFRVTTKVTNVPAELVEIRYAIWSEENGQDDLRWISGTRNGDSWSTDYTTIKNTGTYFVHIYGYMNDGSMIMLGTTDFKVSVPTWDTEIENKDEENGTFDVVIKNIDSKSGVNQIQVPVWCAEDQSDMVWYTANKQNDGSYKVTVDISNHKYHSGEYKIHIYLTAGNGMVHGRIENNETVQSVKAKINVKDISEQEKEYQITVKDVGVIGDVKEIQIAVWSEENDQDDIQWICTGPSTRREVSVNVRMDQFKSYGTYNVHVYGVVDGKQKMIGTTTFKVSVPTWDIEIENKDEENGTFDVVIKNIDSKSGVSQVQVPVWCANNQSDIVWYTANKQNDGSYKVTVSVANHGYHFGEYKVHTYVTGGNGLRKNIPAKNVRMEP